MADIKKVIESIDNDGKLILSNLIDDDTGEEVTFKEISTYYDGSPMNDSKCDGIIYRKYKNKYFIKSFDLDVSRTLVLNTIESIRTMDLKNIILINLKYYRIVQTLGYHNINDGGGAEYIYNNNSQLEDDGFINIKINSLNIGRLELLITDGIINVKKAGAISSDIEDSTDSFKKVFNSNFRSIFIPAGTYIISDTINIQTKTTISGVFQRTIIKFTKPNSTCFVANPKELNSNVFNYGTLKNLRIEGVGRNKQELLDNNQQAINIQGFQSSFENLDCYYFNYAMRIQGVCLDFNNCTISNNNVGISLDDYKRGESTTFNTMIDIIKCNFQYHYIAGLVNIGHGQTLSNGTQNTVQLTLESCVFENNNSYNELEPSRGFILKPYSCVLRNTWFELNQGRSQIWKYRLLVENTRYETGSTDQTIEYVTEYAGAGAFRGSLDLNLVTGRFGAEGYDFQYFDPNGTGSDIGNLRLQEKHRTRRYLELYNKNTSEPFVIPVMPIMTSSSGTNEREPVDKIGVITIKPDGTIYNRSVEQFVSVTKISTGFYSLIFNTYTRGYPQLTVSNPTSTGGTSNVSDTYYGTMSLRNEQSASDYNSYGNFNRMFIKIYRKGTKTITTSTGDVDIQDDVLADGWIHLVIFS